MIINRTPNENNCPKVFLYRRKVLYLTIIKKQTNMQDLINITGIHTIDIINNDHYEKTPGKFRFITKCKAGYMTCNDARDFDDERLYNNPASVLSSYKKGALHTVEYKPAGSDNFFTVFAKKGNKIIVIDEAIMRGLDVGCVNQLWYNTNLYNSDQYRAVNSKTWADKVFVMNQQAEVEAL